MAFGLSEAGFTPKTRDDIQTEIEAALRAAFGASIDLSDTSNFGQFVGILADRLADLWDVEQAIYSSTDPDKASGQALAAIGAITGATPLVATASTVSATLTGTPGTVIPTGKTASVAVIGTRFDTLADATLAAATAWVATTAYVVGDVRTNGGNIYSCTVAGTSAGLGGPTTTGTAITDGSVTWFFVGAGTGFATVSASAETTGPRIAVTGSLTVIETPVSGWSAVNNLADAVLGRDAETDPQFRVRREDELLGASRSVIDAIRTRVLEDVANVTNVIVFMNNTDSTNVDGMPPHSVEVMALGGLDQDIVNAVYANVAAGIDTYGNQTGSFTDVANGGQIYPVLWSRPTLKTVYVIANVTKDPEVFPSDGDTQIANAILAYGATVLPGKNVVSSRLKAAAFTVPGVLDVTTCFIALTVTPTTETTVAIALRELAVYDSSRVIVNLTDGVP